MQRTIPTLGVVLLAAACGSAEPTSQRREPAKAATDTAPTSTPEPTVPDAPEAADPLGSQWEEERRQALAGCVQTVSSELTGAVYAVHRFDDAGWPLQSTAFSGDRVVSEVQTSYVREEGRVVSSVRETLVGAEPVDTGCSDVVSTVSTTYDEAQRPLEAVATVTGCGTSWDVVTTYEHFVEDEELVHTVAYEDGKQVQYTTYDRCAMIRRLDGVKYRNHYDGRCELQFVEQRRYKWTWHYLDLRPVRFTIENNSNDTVYTYADCLE